MTAALLVALLAPAPGPSAGPSCESLRTLKLVQTTIASAEPVAAGPFTAPEGPPIENLPAFCRVTGSIAPSADSDIRFEVWLPASGWNGRLRGLGNGGFAGSISYPPMGSAVSAGYAVVASDTGHRGAATDARWAAGHPEKVIDFGYRAVHETTERAKALVRAFYGRPAQRAYFHSCSNGGREALMEAQRFPDDYDGIVAGAPANFFTHLVTKGAWEMQATLADPAGYITAAKLPAIEAAALAACDAKDGLKDGLVDDPSQCSLDPATLACAGTESDACLSAAQVGTLKKLYAGPHTKDGRPVHGHQVVGGETGPGGWSLWVTGPAPGQSLLAAFATGFYRDMVFERPDWDFRTFDLDRDMKVADDKLAGTLNAVDPDLGRFRDRGGKLLVYHGWDDAAIAASNSIEYYQSVRTRLGAKETDAFARLFLVPGMMHCAGGPGPNAFIGPGALHPDADHDVERAVERWVEKGTAPERIVAVRYTGGRPGTGVARTRPLCPYPLHARWSGSGSIDDAASFACAP